MENCPNHSLGSSFVVLFTVDVDDLEARRVAVGRSGGWFGSGWFCLFGTTPQLLEAKAQAETMTRVSRIQGFLDEVLHVGWV